MIILLRETSTQDLSTHIMWRDTLTRKWKSLRLRITRWRGRLLEHGVCFFNVNTSTSPPFFPQQQSFSLVHRRVKANPDRSRKHWRTHKQQPLKCRRCYCSFCRIGGEISISSADQTWVSLARRMTDNVWKAKTWHEIERWEEEQPSIFESSSKSNLRNSSRWWWLLQYHVRSKGMPSKQTEQSLSSQQSSGNLMPHSQHVNIKIILLTNGVILSLISKTVKILEPNTALDNKLNKLKEVKLKAKLVQEARKNILRYSLHLLWSCVTWNTQSLPNTSRSVVDESCSARSTKTATFILRLHHNHGASASQTAAKVQDTTSRWPGMAGEASDAVSAITQERVIAAPRQPKLPETNDPVIPSNDIIKTSQCRKLGNVTAVNAFFFNRSKGWVDKKA